MNRDDVIKFIDGKIFYYSDYINFLYEQLQLRDEIIKEAREYITSQEFFFLMNEGRLSKDIDNSYFKAHKNLLEILDKVGDSNE